MAIIMRNLHPIINPTLLKVITLLKDTIIQMDKEDHLIILHLVSIILLLITQTLLLVTQIMLPHTHQQPSMEESVDLRVLPNPPLLCPKEALPSTFLVLPSTHLLLVLHLRLVTRHLALLVKQAADLLLPSNLPLLPLLLMVALPSLLTIPQLMAVAVVVEATLLLEAPQERLINLCTNHHPPPHITPQTLNTQTLITPTLNKELHLLLLSKDLLLIIPLLLASITMNPTRTSATRLKKHVPSMDLTEKKQSEAKRGKDSSQLLLKTILLHNAYMRTKVP